MTRNNVFVGDKRVLRRYIGDRLIFDDLSNKSEVLSGTEIFTDKADEDAVVHVEVEGKSYQHAGSGKNLFRTKELKSLNPTSWFVTAYIYKFKLKPNTKYTLSSNVPTNGNSAQTVLHFNGSTTSANGVYDGKSNSQTTDSEGNVFIAIPTERTYTEPLRNGEYWVQLEEGSTATTYEPPAPSPDYPIEIHSLNDFDVVSQKSEGGIIDKINLLLDEPLRSIGDVKDRLFRDTDGLWKIERNIKQVVFGGTESFIWATAPYIPTPLSKTKRTQIKCSHLVYSSNIFTQKGKVSWGGSPNSNKNMFFGIDTWDDLNDFRSWVVEQAQLGTPLTVQYELDVPPIEILGKELQDKLNNLRSFKDSNYIYTVLPDKSNILSEKLKPTLHATFKSKGWEDFRRKLTGGTS